MVPPEERLLLRRSWAALASFAAIAAGGIWYAYKGQAGQVAAMQGMLAKMGKYLDPTDLLPYYLTMFKSWSFMALNGFWPVNLAPEYQYSIPAGWLDPWVLSGVALAIAYLLLLYFCWRRFPGAFFSLALFGAFWLPTSNIWPLAYFAADRYLYAPAAGIFLLAGMLIVRIPLPPLRWGLVALAFAAAVCLTWQQNGYWHSNMTLWSRAVEVNPESTTALNNLGAAYLVEGERREAIKYFKRAAQRMNDPMPFYNLGKTYEQLGELDQALTNYRYFLSFKEPQYATEARELQRRLLQTYGARL